jgi:hypothetical protein
VKPANLGSSIGISKVHDGSELAVAMDEAAVATLTPVADPHLLQPRSRSGPLIANAFRVGLFCGGDSPVLMAARKQIQRLNATKTPEKSTRKRAK